MKTISQKYWIRSGIAGLVLAASLGTASAATLPITSFATAADVSAWYFANWNGSTAAIAWSTNDAGASASSGSIKLSIDYDNLTKQGGAFRFTHSANIVSPTAYTAVEYDVKVDPASPLDRNGHATDLKLGYSDNGWGGHNTDLNISLVTTNGGWQHVVVPLSSIGGAGAQPIQEILCQVYDNNYTNAQTAVIYIDNIKFTVADPTYPDFLALTFDDPTNVVILGTTGWYGDAINAYEWVTNDAAGLTTSGSLHIVADFTSGNNACVVAIPFDPLYPGFSSGTPDTNIVINAQHMAAVEMDILWDTNNSTVSITNFNSVGDISGFPLGLLYNSPGGGPGGQSEAFGTGTTSLPDAASNGWVHLRFPLNQSTANIDQCVGLWLKKWQPNAAFSGTVAFYIDNVKFIGGAIPQSGPPLTLGKPVYGLQEVHTAGAYDREGVVTAGSGYSFVNQPNTTYSMNIEAMPPEAGFSARIILVPLSIPMGVDGTIVDPDWAYPNILVATIQRAGTGSSIGLAAKINQPNANGSLYDATCVHPTFNTPSKIEGNWSVKFTANNNILVTAPDGSSTNLAFPGVLYTNDLSSVETNGLTSADVVANFDFGAGMVAYFHSINGSVTGTRMVLAGASITLGATTLLSDNFVTDTNVDTTIWLLPPTGTYLITPSIKWFLDWPV